MMKGLYARMIYRDVVDRKPLEVAWEEFRSLSGNDLKTMMLIKNAGRLDDATQLGLARTRPLHRAHEERLVPSEGDAV